MTTDYFSDLWPYFAFFFFFFQAEDGIRDHCVTGVQTCALPISLGKGSLGCFRALRGNLGTAWRTGADPATGNGHPALADSFRGNWFDDHSGTRNFFSSFAKEGI